MFMRVYSDNEKKSQNQESTISNEAKVCVGEYFVADFNEKILCR